MKKPSDLLASTAEPFDSACAMVLKLEDAAINVVIGRDWRRLHTHDKQLCDLLIDFGLIETKNNIVCKI